MTAFPSLLMLSVWISASLPPPGTVCWHHDYAGAMREATAGHKLVFLVFADFRLQPVIERVVRQMQSDAEDRDLVERHVFVWLPLDAEVDLEQGRTALLSHPAFSELAPHGGVAVIDVTESDSPYYQLAVNLVPKLEHLTAVTCRELLRLPLGSLTQRTLTLAVRTHPEMPQSAGLRFDRRLADECESHAHYQAEIGVQGHHNWGTRFHRINDRLGNMVAQEVCAESWPGQSLWDAAVECVRSWRHSPGHWDAVQRVHPVFAYDMKRGNNGIWYGVGIFADAR